jgi:hypothetical protein
MPTNKRPAPRKTVKQAAEPDNEALAQNLVDIALEIAETDPDDLQAAARKPQLEQDLLVLIRRALRRQHDELLYGAIEVARYTDPECCRLLQEHIEEEAATLRLRDDDGAELEIDAFMIPLFVSSTGGLKAAEVFQDDAAFEELSDSFRHTGLASADSRVVLVRYLYDLDEVDHVGYSGLQQMLRTKPPPTLTSRAAWRATACGPAASNRCCRVACRRNRRRSS